MPDLVIRGFDGLLHEFLSKLQEISDHRIYQEIKNFDTWDGLLSQVEDPAVTKKALIWDWIRSRWRSLMDDVSVEAAEADGMLVVHRCIGVRDPEAFVDALRANGKRGGGKRGLGIYWSYSFATAECYWGELDGTNIVMTGLVNLNFIDVPETVFANFHPDVGEQEKEVRIKKGSPVLLTSVSLDESDPRWQFDPALSLRA